MEYKKMHGINNRIFSFLYYLLPGICASLF